MAFLDDDPVSRRRRGYDISYHEALDDLLDTKQDGHTLTRPVDPTSSREGAIKKLFIDEAVDCIINGKEIVIGIREYLNGVKPNIRVNRK